MHVTVFGPGHVERGLGRQVARRWCRPGGEDNVDGDLRAAGELDGVEASERVAHHPDLPWTHEIVKPTGSAGTGIEDELLGIEEHLVITGTLWRPRSDRDVVLGQVVGRELGSGDDETPRRQPRGEEGRLVPKRVETV